MARQLDEVARLLELQGANAYRVAAYRRGARTLRRLRRPVSTILAERGLEGLERLSGIGPSLARAIGDAVEAGRVGLLERLREETDPVALFASVPGFDTSLAERAHRDLGVATLEQLEAAARDGRLARLGQLEGPRLTAIRNALCSRLRGLPPGTVLRSGVEEPSVAELLELDREYRSAARAGRLPRVTPRRLNPRHAAWLPVLRTRRNGRAYTVHFSNTARAHELYRTRNWVILNAEARCWRRRYTVITTWRGVLRGRRVVRGRERESLKYYREQGAVPPVSASDANDI